MMSEILPEQLANWCDVHDVELIRRKNLIAATAYFRNKPIARVSKQIQRSKKPDEAEDLPHAIEVCDQLAEEILILKPSVTFKLNQ